jgi:uncharacterized membrane protein
MNASILLLLLTSLALTIHYAHTFTITTPRRRHPTTSLPSQPNDAMLRQIDQKISRYERQHQKYLDRLTAAQSELEKYKQTKQYLASSPAYPTNFSETTARSLVKSILWRIIAGSVTFFTSLRFSSSIKTAIRIVSSDFFSKALTMFLGERMMNMSKAGRKGGADNVQRSLVKALLWRVFAICNTLCMSFLISKNLSVASKIAGSDAVFKTGLMFVYERVWARIEWGKEYVIEFSI